MIMKRINSLFKHLFKRKLDQNEELIKNMKEYDKKKKVKQYKSKIQIGERKR
jgi:hypothetical protein